MWHGTWHAMCRVPVAWHVACHAPLSPSLSDAINLFVCQMPSTSQGKGQASCSGTMSRAMRPFTTRTYLVNSHAPIHHAHLPRLPGNKGSTCSRLIVRRPASLCPSALACFDCQQCRRHLSPSFLPRCARALRPLMCDCVRVWASARASVVECSRR